MALATSAYGISFGALGVAAGLDIWQTCVLSLLMFTGGSQFAFVGVIAAGGLAAAPAAIASSALLGVRNVAYGMRMSPVIGAGFWRRLAAAQFGGVHRVLFQDAVRRTLNGQTNDEIATALAETARTAFNLLTPALATYAVL